MEVARMKAERRTALGRNQIQKLRQEGWMPAVVYGAGKEPVSIQISEWELERHVSAHHKVYQLDIAGQQESAFLQDVAWKATTDRPLHADFLRIDLNKPLESEVEITLIGHPAGLSKGGALTKDHLIIRVQSLPTAIPEGIEIDISKMDLGEVLRASDLPLPEGVQLAIEPETPICHVTQPSASAAAADEAEPEGEEGK